MVVISLFHANPQQIKIKPQTLVVLETAFDEAWLTLKSIGNTTVKPDELARYVLRLAMEGERDPLQKELRKVALRVILGISAFGEEIKKQTFPGRKDRAGVNVRMSGKRCMKSGAISRDLLAIRRWFVTK